MITKLFTFFILIFLTTPTFSQCVVDYSQLTLVWEDEFTKPLSNNWWKRNDCCYNCYHVKCGWKFEEDMLVHEPLKGVLVFKTEPMTEPAPCGNLEGNCGRKSKEDLPVIDVKASGIISKKNFPDALNLNREFVMYEARVKLPKNDFTMFPSFWLGGSDGEIDIFEHYQTAFSNSAIDWGEQPYQYCNTTYKLPSDVDLSEDFHTFGALWNNDSILGHTVYFFFDGVLLGSQDIAHLPNNISMNIRIDNKINNKEKKIQANHKWVASEMYLDYVRLYKLEDITTFLDGQSVPSLEGGKVHPQEYSVAVAANTAQVYYRGTDNRLHYDYIDNSQEWQHFPISPTFELREKVGGDVIAGNEQNSVYFVGTDYKIHYYAIENDRWVHTLLKDGDGNALEVLPRMPGVFDIDRAGNIVFINQDNQIVFLEKLGKQTYKKSIRLSTKGYVPLGDIKLLDKHIFYRANQVGNGKPASITLGTLQFYVLQENGDWKHNDIKNSDGSPFKVNIFPGSIDKDETNTAIFANNNKRFIHRIYKDKQTGAWTVQSLAQNNSTSERCIGKVQYLEGQNVVSYVGVGNRVNYYRFIMTWVHHVETANDIKIKSNLAYTNGGMLYFRNRANRIGNIRFTACRQNHNICNHVEPGEW